MSADTIGDAVRYFESRRLRYEIIVAADGTDGTREIVRDLARSNSSLRAIGSEARRGKGRGSHSYRPALDREAECADLVEFVLEDLVLGVQALAVEGSTICHGAIPMGPCRRPQAGLGDVTGFRSDDD